MSSRALNLLQHPRREWPVDGPQLRWGLLGAGLTLGLGWLLQAQHSDLLQEQQHWKQQLSVQAQQQSQQRALHERQRVLAEQQALWRNVLDQDRQRLALQAALQREADQGLRLARWQADGQRLWLQGQLPQTEALPGLQARLGQALGQSWTLQSLGAGGAPSGLLWTLEAPWPPASTSRATP